LSSASSNIDDLLRKLQSSASEGARNALLNQLAQREQQSAAVSAPLYSSTSELSLSLWVPPSADISLAPVPAGVTSPFSSPKKEKPAVSIPKTDLMPELINPIGNLNLNSPTSFRAPALLPLPVSPHPELLEVHFLCCHCIELFSFLQGIFTVAHFSISLGI
jgi:hypothetical protein